MERNVSIRPTTDNCCSCNACGARNYVSIYAKPGDKVVDTIYNVRISIMCNQLCLDCLKALVSEAEIILAKETEES